MAKIIKYFKSMTMSDMVSFALWSSVLVFLFAFIGVAAERGDQADEIAAMGLMFTVFLFAALITSVSIAKNRKRNKTTMKTKRRG